MRRDCGFQNIFARTITWIDKARSEKLSPGIQIERAPFTLAIRAERTTNIRSFAPFQSEPEEILDAGFAKFRTAALWIEIFDSQNHHAVVEPGTLLCLPKGQRVPDVQITGWGRRNAATVRNSHRKNMITVATVSP
jgi:hypothetical protein